MAVASRGEWCCRGADIVGIVEGGANLDPNSSAKATVIAGGVRVLTEKRYSVRFALMCRSRSGDRSTRARGSAKLGFKCRWTGARYYY